MCARPETTKLMEHCDDSRCDERGSMQKMWKLWIRRRPTSTINRCTCRLCALTLTEGSSYQSWTSKTAAKKQHSWTVRTQSADPAVENNVKELDDSQPPAVTVVCTELRIKMVARLKTPTQPLKQRGWICLNKYTVKYLKPRDTVSLESFWIFFFFSFSLAFHFCRLGLCSLNKCILFQKVFFMMHAV